MPRAKALGNNHPGAYIAGIRNSIGAYIVITASLQQPSACVAKQLLRQIISFKTGNLFFKTLVNVQLMIRTLISHHYSCTNAF